MCLSYPSISKNDNECLNIKSENKQRTSKEQAKREQYNQSEPQSEHRTANPNNNPTLSVR